MPALLTIVIPTFNRARTLALLLEALNKQLKGFENQVDIIVGDNASTDETQSITHSFLTSCPTAIILRHAKNIGPDENFCRCLDRVQTKYFWIIGDDDLPKSSILKSILEFLTAQNPDLLYLNSEWMPVITNENDGKKLDHLSAITLSRQEFSRQVNVWITFISGMIINRERLFFLQPDLNIRQFTGSSLVQLGWVLPLLMKGDRFLLIHQPCILATSGNSGGYKILEVFATNFLKILNIFFDEKSIESKLIRNGLIFNYIPSLVWMSRSGVPGNFLKEDILSSIKPLRRFIGYWILILPIWLLPRPIAYFFWIASRIYGRFIKITLPMRATLTRSTNYPKISDDHNQDFFSDKKK